SIASQMCDSSTLLVALPISQIVGGGEIVTGETAFHNSSMDVVKRSLRLSQSPDLFWESEDEALHYNNAALIGFTGYMPTAKKDRSEEHTSELQSRENIVCRL